MPSSLINIVKESFQKIFNQEPIMVKSPGRINVIGEHVDYNGGFTFPAAIDKCIVLGFSTNQERKINIHSLDFDKQVSVNLADRVPADDWSDYIIGVVDEMVKRFGDKVKGFNVVFSGNIPMGSGMSSSAALECGIAIGMNDMFSLGLEPLELALISQAAENNFVGVKCGLMDQFASIFGKNGKLIQMNCRDNSFEYRPLELDGYEFILCNSMVSHSFSTGNEYNLRRSQCESGLRELQKKHSLSFLTDASLWMLNEVKEDIDTVVYNRCKYVIEEMERGKQIASILSNNDTHQLGSLMYETHWGLSKLYEVSCKELDFLVKRTALR